MNPEIAPGADKSSHGTPIGRNSSAEVQKRIRPALNTFGGLGRVFTIVSILLFSCLRKMFAECLLPSTKALSSNPPVGDSKAADTTFQPLSLKPVY